MKILIAVHHFPPTFVGGAEWRAWRTANGLIHKGHDAHVVCVESIDTGDGKLLVDGISLFRNVPVTRLRFNMSRAPDPMLYSYNNPAIAHTITKLASDFQPDVLHLISGYLMTGSVVEAAHAMGLPVVLTLTDFWFLCPRITLIRSDDAICSTPARPDMCALCLRKERRRYRKFDYITMGFAGKALQAFWRLFDDPLLKSLEQRRQYLKKQFGSVDVVISPSLFLKKLFEDQKLATKRFLYIRQGLNLVEKTSPVKRKISTPIRIGYIGQIAKHKGVDLLVDAFCRLKKERNDAELILYGSNSQFPRFSNQIQKKIQGHADITMAGRFDNTRIRQIYSSIDVLVVPSVWYENSPNVILEAFAMGTPAVVSRLGGMAELVDNGTNGFHFDPGSADSLAHVLQMLIDDPGIISRLSNAMPPIKTLSEEISELSEVYASL